VELRDKARQERLIHNRTPEIRATLALGLKLFLQFASDIGAIDKTERASLWARGWEELGAASSMQSSFQQSEEPCSRFLSLLLAALTSGQAHLADVLEGHPEDAGQWGWRKKIIGYDRDEREEWIPLGSKVGWIDEDDIYLEPEAVYRVVQRYASEQNESLPIRKSTLWKRMNEKGYLASHEKDKNLSRVTVEGKRRYVVHILANRLPGGG
jgi:hypothetical protein